MLIASCYKHMFVVPLWDLLDTYIAPISKPCVWYAGLLDGAHCLSSLLWSDTDCRY